jgi:hypothetical protein
MGLRMTPLRRTRKSQAAIADLRERARARVWRRLPAWPQLLAAFWITCAIAAVYLLGFGPPK